MGSWNDILILTHVFFGYPQARVTHLPTIRWLHQTKIWINLCRDAPHKHAMSSSVITLVRTGGGLNSPSTPIHTVCMRSKLYKNGREVSWWLFTKERWEIEKGGWMICVKCFIMPTCNTHTNPKYECVADAILLRKMSWSGIITLIRVTTMTNAFSFNSSLLFKRVVNWHLLRRVALFCVRWRLLTEQL